MRSGDEQWQRRMMPFMAVAIVFAALLFSVILVARFSAIATTLQDPPQAEIAIPWTSADAGPKSWQEQKQLAQLQANFALEREIIARRYRQAAAAQSLRLWTRLMGFLTGMLMAIMGSAFVLGKLSGPDNDISGSASGASISIKTASPGIIMAVLGTILIGMTITTTVRTDVRDSAIYFGRPGEEPREPVALDLADPQADADVPPRPGPAGEGTK